MRALRNVCVWGRRKWFEMLMNKRKEQLISAEQNKWQREQLANITSCVSVSIGVRVSRLPLLMPLKGGRCLFARAKLYVRNDLRCNCIHWSERNANDDDLSSRTKLCFSDCCFIYIYIYICCYKLVGPTLCVCVSVAAAACPFIGCSTASAAA